MKKYKVKPNGTLIVTDSTGDIKEAKEVGIKSLGVSWGVHNEVALKAENPHFIATKPSDIITGVASVLNSQIL